MSDAESHSHDAKVIGPGTWDMMHRTSVSSDPTLFILVVKFVYDNFPCAVCRRHFQEYCTKNPPWKLKPEPDKEGNDLSRFKWMWICHNVVNERLGKRIVEWIMAVRMYLQSPLCTEGCSEEEGKA